MIPLRNLAPAILALVLAAAPPAAQSGEAGDFDYYVLTLSWNASWCEAEGDAREAEQCDPSHDHGWVLHGLWPQYADGGWPEYCRTDEANPPRWRTAQMVDIMGSAGLAWHQWKKHGRCSGLSADAYFDLSREAWEGVERPELLRRLEQAVTIDPDVVEEAFLAANPGLDAEAVVVTCHRGRIAEVRVCLDPELSPRGCGPDVERGVCRRPARLPPMR